MNKFVHRVFDYLPSSIYVAVKYYYHNRKFLNLKHPKGFNEKLQWLKLNDKNPLYVNMVDKHEAKRIVGEIIGFEYIIPEYGVWESFDDIKFDLLPDQFVLKTTHDCGGVVVCKDKNKFDYKKSRDFINSHLKSNYYSEGREWPYKNIKPRIIAEQFMTDKLLAISSDVDHNADGLIDYKFYCFNGEPKFLYVAFANMKNGCKNDMLSFYTMDWKPAPFYRTDHEPFPLNISKPDGFEEMVRIAKKLANGIPFVRVDLFWINNKVYFSELTLTPGSGFGLFSPEEWELKIGDWITLPID